MPRVLWAQRKDIVYLTFEVFEAQNESIETSATSIKFSAMQPSNGDQYSCELEFYAEVDPSQTQQHKTDRAISLILKKADSESPFWPRLVKSGKPHFVHTDFARWKDEDEVSEAEAEADPSMGMGMGGGFGGGNMDFSQFANMAGSGGFPSMDGGEEEEDSDKEHDVEEDPYQKTRPAVIEEDSE